MATDTPAAPNQDWLKVPWDLSEWIPRPTLWAWIVEDIGNLDWENPELLELLRANPAYRPKLLLCLITYGYALGVWESLDIAELYDADEMIRRLDGGPPPSPQMVTRFRRDNRPLFKWALAHVLKRVVKSHFNLGEGLFPPGYKRYVIDAALARIDVARHVERAAQGA